MEGRTSIPLEDLYPSIAAVIPAYNAAAAVGDVVRKVRVLSPSIKVIVVDDGSNDTTSKVAEEAGAVVVRHRRNMGKGEALRTGFREALKYDIRAVVTLDADGQHSPAEISKLAGRWAQTGADIIIGSRKRDVRTMPPLRIMTNTLSSLLVSLSAGRYVHDSQSGYRLLSRRVVQEIPTRSRGYGAESEILIKAAAHGFRIESTQVSTIYGSERSHIRPWKQPFLFLGLIIRSFLWRFERFDRR